MKKQDKKTCFYPHRNETQNSICLTGLVLLLVKTVNKRIVQQRSTFMCVRVCCVVKNKSSETIQFGFLTFQHGNRH